MADKSDKNEGFKKLEQSYQHFLRTASDSDLTDVQRNRILEGLKPLLEGRDAYEAIVQGIHEETLAGFWQLLERSPAVEIEPLAEDISQFFADAHAALFEQNDDTDAETDTET